MVFIHNPCEAIYKRPPLGSITLVGHEVTCWYCLAAVDHTRSWRCLHTMISITIVQCTTAKNVPIRSIVVRRALADHHLLPMSGQVCVYALYKFYIVLFSSIKGCISYSCVALLKASRDLWISLYRQLCRVRQHIYYPTPAFKIFWSWFF